MFPFQCRAKTRFRRRKMMSRRKSEDASHLIRPPQLVWKWHPLLLHKGNHFASHSSTSWSLLSALILTAFIYSFFFLVVDQKYGSIWRQCTTWCVSWPLQSGVTTAVGGALKKCQLAIKVPQTSIMSSSYESLGTAQNWAIMSTVKNGCRGAQHSPSPLIIAQPSTESLSVYDGTEVCVKNSSNSHHSYGGEMTLTPSLPTAWPPWMIPQRKQEWSHCPASWSLSGPLFWAVSCSNLKVTSG